MIKLIYNESVQIKPKGSARGYIGTLEIEPKSDCKGIPDKLMKYISNIRTPIDRWTPVSSYELNSGKLYAVLGPINKLVVEYNTNVGGYHTTDIAKNAKMIKAKEEAYNELVSGLESAGWLVKE